MFLICDVQNGINVKLLNIADLEGESLLDDENGTAAPSGPSAASWTNRIPPSLGTMNLNTHV